MSLQISDWKFSMRVSYEREGVSYPLVLRISKTSKILLGQAVIFIVYLQRPFLWWKDRYAEPLLMLFIGYFLIKESFNFTLYKSNLASISRDQIFISNEFLLFSFFVIYYILISTKILTKHTHYIIKSSSMIFSFPSFSQSFP